MRDKQAKLGILPKSDQVLLREWARTVLDLERVAGDLEKPSIRKQATVYRRLKREQKGLRLVLVKFDQRLETLATQCRQRTVPTPDELIPEASDGD